MLIALFSVRSDRQFCEQLDFNLLFRWFLDMERDEPAFDASTFSQNRELLIRNRVGEEFLAAVVREAQKQRLLSDDHFSVDGTMIEAWASIRSFRRKGDPPRDSNGWKDFKGDKLSNETHESKTDPDSRLARKGNGQPAKLSFCGNVLMEIDATDAGLEDDQAVLDAGAGEDSGSARQGLPACRLRAQPVLPLAVLLEVDVAGDDDDPHRTPGGWSSR